MFKFINTIIIISISILLASCSMAPPKETAINEYDIPEKFDTVENLSKDELSNVKFIVSSKDSLVDVRWWESFGDVTLNSIVDKVILNNLDVKLAITRVKMLESQFDISRARRYPSLNLSSGYSKTEGPVTSFEMTQAGAVMGKSIDTYDNYSLRTGFRFELDIWGKLNNLENSAIAELMASKSDLQVVYLNVISSAINLYYDIYYQQEQIILSEKTLEIYKHNKEVMKKRYSSGTANKINIGLIEQAFFSTESKLESEKMALHSKMFQLSVLMGEYPNFLSNKTEFSYSSISEELKSILPTAIPSELLKTRPDIIAAEYKLESAREQVGASKADLFPSISLTAGLNLVSGDFDELFSEDALTKTIGAEFSQVLFAGGSKLANLDMKKVLYEQAIISYKKTVLIAFMETENVLNQIMFFTKQEKSLTNLLSASSDVKSEYEKRYLNGLVSYDKLLDAEKSIYSSKLGLLTVKKMLLVAKVSLHRALGGK